MVHIRICTMADGGGNMARRDQKRDLFKAGRPRATTEREAGSLAQSGRDRKETENVCFKEEEVAHDGARGRLPRSVRAGGHVIAFLGKALAVGARGKRVYAAQKPLSGHDATVRPPRLNEATLTTRRR
jgi:hypothetical protein